MYKEEHFKQIVYNKLYAHIYKKNIYTKENKKNKNAIKNGLYKFVFK